MASEIKIEVARFEDLSAIQAIYAHHVLNGLGTFEETPPTIEDMEKRFDKITADGFPFLVARLTDKVIGYAYASHFRERSAYRFTVEDSIYIDKQYQGSGVGSMLLKELIVSCKQRGYLQMLALIGDSNNRGSVNLHKKHGFELIGIMKNVGYKFEKFVDVVVMQLDLEV
ncbi:GNAT family N-acetyltransferase [Aquella oligotrophica]|uniref:GNAT family N-acetyltransferase n=1 Tax=Aquella oligotrophica TaxID=2067065 RepID=UPI001C99B7E1|nr:GNAT family N-acetyltransferase [Aquella oligotrophica]